MPNRILREGIVTSERVNSLDWGAEVFYRRLMSVVDDFGRYTANAKLLLGTCYALQLDRVSLSDIERWIADCQQENLLLVYEVSGKRFLEIIDFKQQIRSKQSKHPAPADGVICECVADANHPPANAHLVGVGVGVEDVYGVGDGGVGDKPPTSNEATVEPSRATQIAVFLRKSGIDGASASNPIIDEWSRNPRVTDELLETAVAMVRARKPTRPGPSYMQHIVNDLLNPKIPNARASPIDARDERRRRAYEVLTGNSGASPHERPDESVVDVQAKRIG
jgi:hypothetical protein